MSSSTLRGRVDLGAEAIAQLRRAEEEMRARRLEAATAGLGAKAEEFARMRVADAKEFAAYAARCDALGGTLPRAELAREQAAIVQDAKAGDRAAAAGRVRRLEQRADREGAMSLSQRLVTETILGRAGRFTLKAQEGNAVAGTLDLGSGVVMPLRVVSAPPSAEGGPTAHEVVFETAKSTPGSCPEQHEAARQIARAAGPEVTVGGDPDDEERRRRRRRKQARRATADKKRRAG